ncbi:MAG TPA: PAS domain-containing sensor histidine kinase [Cyclobacteriaceae bacterium]|nr:PAS domain-containing sensor histidine kinase [Cyclobacteriaceae bacterium]
MRDQMVKSENFLQDLFEDSASIVLITDGEFNIRYCSSSVQALLGIDPLSVVGKNAFEFTPPEVRDQWKGSLVNVEKSARTEICLKNQNNECVYFDVSVANRIASHDIRGLVIMLHDVTLRKRKAIQLQKENEHLDQFIFKTTHDLRSPIHSALGLLNLLEKAPEKERGLYLEMTRNTLFKLETLIEEVNHLYKVDKMAVKREQIDLRNIIEGEVSVLKNYPNGRNVNFEWNYSEDTILFSDVLRVRTIVSNLLSNAVKYSDPTKETSFVRIDAKTNYQWLIITITDNGIGIAEENIGHIFEIFYRATNKGSGTGLGLHIVKDTIGRLNGTIEVKSKLGQGTQFKVSLPNLAFSNSNAVFSTHGKTKAVL